MRVMKHDIADRFSSRPFPTTCDYLHLYSLTLRWLLLLHFAITFTHAAGIRLALPGSSWLLLALPGSSWLLLAPPGSSWLLLAPNRLRMAQTCQGFKAYKALEGFSQGLWGPYGQAHSEVLR